MRQKETRQRFFSFINGPRKKVCKAQVSVLSFVSILSFSLSVTHSSSGSSSLSLSFFLLLLLTRYRSTFPSSSSSTQSVIIIIIYCPDREVCLFRISLLSRGVQRVGVSRFPPDPPLSLSLHYGLCFMVFPVGHDDIDDDDRCCATSIQRRQTDRQTHPHATEAVTTTGKTESQEGCHFFSFSCYLPMGAKAEHAKMGTVEITIAIFILLLNYSLRSSR